jgi:hypothetical protein
MRLCEAALKEVARHSRDGLFMSQRDDRIDPHRPRHFLWEGNRAVSMCPAVSLTWFVTAAFVGTKQQDTGRFVGKPEVMARIVFTGITSA